MLLERTRVFEYLQVDSLDLGETCKLNMAGKLIQAIYQTSEMVAVGKPT